MAGEGKVYTLAVEMRLAQPLDTAELGRMLAAKMEEVVEDGFDLDPLFEVSGIVCRHPLEGTIRHVSMEPV